MKPQIYNIFTLFHECISRLMVHSRYRWLLVRMCRIMSSEFSFQESYFFITSAIYVFLQIHTLVFLSNSVICNIFSIHLSVLIRLSTLQFVNAYVCAPYLKTESTSFYNLCKIFISNNKNIALFLSLFI